MLKSAGISRQAAEWSLSLTIGAIPEQVLADTKLRVLDILGVSLAASTTDVGRVVRDAAICLGAGDEARVIGFGDRLSAASAAVANGTLAHTLDYDDTHNRSVIHVSAPSVATALTAGEAVAADGAMTLAALIAGSELVCRIGIVVPGGFHARGYHATGVIGTFGAAITAGRLFGLDANQTVNALGIAGSQAAGILEFFSDGSSAKRFHPGWAAHSGIAAVYLARAGFTGPATVLEGRYGLFNTHLGPGEYDVESILDDLGERWECINTSYKPYPCGHVVHPFLDAVLALHREEGLRAEDVEQITCPIAEWMIPIMCEPREIKLKPKTDYHAKFSFPFSIAAALHFGRLGVEAYSEENIRNPAILALAERIIHEPDPTAPDTSRFKGWVKVKTKDGRTLERIVENNWGSEANPMTPDQVRRKFRENAELALEPARVDEIIAVVDGMENLRDVGAIIGLCTTKNI